MVKYYDEQFNRYVPISTIECRLPVWGTEYGGAFMPNRDGNACDFGDRISIKFDDFQELKAYQEAVNRMVDSLENILYNRKEESIELFKERVS